MSEKRFTVMKKFDGSYVICDKVEMLVADDCCDLLNELNNDFEDCEKLLESKDGDIEELGISIKLFEDDIATKDKKIEEQQATITELAKKWRVLSQENMQLKDYIDTIFEDNTHICKYLDVEDVQFYCDKNKNYRNPSCLYEKCFDEENLIKIKDEIRRVIE